MFLKQFKILSIMNTVFIQQYYSNFPYVYINLTAINLIEILRLVSLVSFYMKTVWNTYVYIKSKKIEYGLQKFPGYSEKTMIVFVSNTIKKENKFLRRV